MYLAILFIKGSLLSAIKTFSELFCVLLHWKSNRKINILYNGKEATVNRALDGSIYPS
jgi:hypothetical protein